jgi:hypothetical protein
MSSKSKLRLAILSAFVLVFNPCKATETSNLAAPPPPAEPDLRGTKPVVVCVNCEEPFDAATHQKILTELLNNPYITELRKASYYQDIVHQFESKAHFDNCDFDSTLDYIDALMGEAKIHAEAAQRAKSSNDKTALETEVKSAFWTLGQLLHAVQDFYAHSNYVEIEAPKVAKVTDIKIVEPWKPEGREFINQGRKMGLISGVVFWGFPQKCPAGTLSHGDLAKDSADTISGKKLIAHLQNISQYRVAVFLAREASTNLISDAFKRWPILEEVNGKNVAFDVLIDRRGI